MDTKTGKGHSVALAWFGIFATAVAVIMLMACISAYPDWVAGTDTVSKFGTSNTDAADYFKYGCMAIGVLLAVFSISFIVGRTTYGNTTGGVLMLLAAVCLILVGLYKSTGNTQDTHDFFAVMMTILAMFAMVAITAQNWYDGHEFTAGIGIIAFCVIIGALIAFNTAKFEEFALVAFTVWLITESGLIIKMGLKE